MKISVEQCLRRNVFACSAVFAGLMVNMLMPAPSSFGEGLSDSVLRQISALQSEKASRTPAQLKLDSQLVYAWKRAQGLPYAPGVTSLKLGVNIESDGRVQVDMDAEVNPALLQAVQDVGGTVQFSSVLFKSIRALVPLSQTESLASRTDVKFIRPAVQAFTRTGSVDSEGDTTHRAIEARPNFLTDGFGVNVGILSDSVDYMAAAQATGDLPPNVNVLPGQSGIPASGEGTAMLEIVYDLAPGAGLFYATAFGGPAAFAQNILNLRAAGCDIIVDDVGYFNESPFQDDLISQAVSAVVADGAMYFSSAGNEGNLRHGTSGTWEGDFVDGGAAGTPVNGKGGNLHLFGTNAYNTITVPGGFVSMFWSDPLGASTNDYDLYVVDTNGTALISSSTTVQNGTQDPYEFAFATDFNQRVVVVKATGDPRFIHIENFRGQLEINTSGNIKGHSCATNAMAVAAVDIHTAYPNPFTGGANNPVEDFSTDGPRHVFYNADGTPITPTNFLATGGYIRQKPDMSAADGVSTTLPSNSGLNPFYGTSAAAPHAAAVAALIKSYNDALSNRNVRNLMNFTALDIEATGYDNTAGSGIVMAYQALQAAPLPTPFPRPVYVTNYISMGNGNGIIDFNECNNLDIVLTNIGRADATGVRATLSSTTPGVTIARPTVPYANIPVGSAATNLISFQVSTAPDFNCGIPIQFSLVVKSDQNSFTNVFTVATGVPGIPIRFSNNQTIPIPDAGVAFSTISLTNINFALNKLTVSMHITHTFDADLLIQLVSPDGTTNTLSANHGSFGQDYGFTCAPDSQRTTFDDAATTPIAFATAPFVGTFLPDQPLSVFAGKAGTNLNGNWTLRVQDTSSRDVGNIQCWSMILTPTLCVDGGGECPGADLGVGMSAQPEPVIIGNYLIYSISVTNNGPSLANSVVVSHVLPTSAIFVSATPSQGGFSQAGGVLTCNLGPMKSKGTATISVVVLPTIEGLVSSSASVSSEQPDFVSANNTATVFTHVNPPTSDLVAQLVGVPNPAVVGAPLTYIATVTNKGPSSATGVWLTNVLPSNVIVRSAVTSQGVLSTASNVVLVNFGSMTNGQVAMATIATTPTVAGVLVASASTVGNQFDPIVTNNTSTVITSVGSAADLALSIFASPNPVVVRSNLTYQVTVTNIGPNSATSVMLNQSLPSSVSIVSSSASQGTITQQGGTLTAAIGTLDSGASALITVVLTPNLNGPVATIASVSAAQVDPDTSNNTATNTVQVSPPFISIVPSGASLLAESLSPTNGAIDIGETVTVSLRLRNAGNIGNTNLVATLLATDGVTPVAPNAPQTYGVLQPSGFPVARSFSFTANGTNGQTITAQLQLQDGSANLGTVSFNFTLPSVYTFANTNAIAILDNRVASVYPSVISVTGITGLVGNVSVTLSNVSHTFPQDIDALLVGPSGQSTMLMSGAGAAPLTTADVTFDDRAPSVVPDSTSQIVSGSYRPADYLPALSLPAPAPAGPYMTALSVFNTVNPLTNWFLYVDDHTTGDTGRIVGGWSLELTMITPVNQLADVGVVGNTSPKPSVANGNLTYVFTVTNAGPNAASFVAFTNALPAGVALISASASQGTLLTNATSVGLVLASLKAGEFATINVVVSPSASVAGQLTSIASVAATETDLNPANNTFAVVSTVSLPVSELAVTQQAAPSPAVIGNNLTYTLSITNAGPGASLNTVLTDPLPPGVSVVSATVSAGTTSIQGNTVICQFGDLAPNGTAVATIVALPSALGTITNVATLTTGSKDPNAGNNTSLFISTVVPPAPLIVNGGATLISESFSPPDSSIEPGETVTIAFALTNAGTAPTAALQATLQPTGGVTSPSGPQNYGVIQNGGSAISRPFTFTAAGGNGGVITATFTLLDGSTDLGTVTFTFHLPTTTSYSSIATVLIPDHGPGNPYPSTINITDSSAGQVTKLKVTLTDVSHSFPHDISALLVSPSGASALLMSHTGGGHGLTNVTLTFDDAAAAFLPNNGVITSGTYKPSSYEAAVTFPRPAPAGPFSKELAVFNGLNPNGTWSLYLLDDTTGDSGVIAKGWSLDITTAVTVNPIADLNVSLASAPSTVYVGDVFTNTITVTNLGPSVATGVMVTNTLPLGVSFVSSTPSGTFVGTFGGYVVVNLGSLPAGGGTVVSVVGAPSVGSTFLSVASAGSQELDLNPVNNIAQTSVKVINPVPATLDGAVANGQFYLSVSAQPGFDYVILTSTNLSSWAPISTNTADAGGLIKYIEPISPTPHYYRSARVLR